jgi:hypothetical protein
MNSVILINSCTIFYILILTLLIIKLFIWLIVFDFYNVEICNLSIINIVNRYILYLLYLLLLLFKLTIFYSNNWYIFITIYISFFYISLISSDWLSSSALNTLIIFNIYLYYLMISVDSIPISKIIPEITNDYIKISIFDISLSKVMNCCYELWCCSVNWWHFIFFDYFFYFLYKFKRLLIVFLQLTNSSSIYLYFYLLLLPLLLLLYF